MQNSEYGKMFKIEKKHWWFKAKKNFLITILSGRNRNLRILDIGCGTGGTTKILEKFGKVTRIDIAPQAQRFLQKEGLNCICRDYLLERFPQNHFDLITMIDSLYHQSFASDRKVLKKVYRELIKGGYLLVIDSAVAFLYGKHDKKMMARERYNLSDLSFKIENCGFSIIKKTYLYFFLFPIFVLIRLLNKIIEIENVKIPNRIINEIFYFLCRIEAFLIKKISLPIGSSVMVLARK